MCPGRGALLAKIDSSGTKYYHQDHLSNRMVTNSSGTDVADIGHFPYGESWYNAAGDKLMFTTYERDAESGNDYAQARYNVNRLGRFSSLDPLAGNISDPQSLNRYSYVRNMPVMLADPSGACPSTVQNTPDGYIEGQGNFVIARFLISDSDSDADPDPQILGGYAAGGCENPGAGSGGGSWTLDGFDITGDTGGYGGFPLGSSGTPGSGSGAFPEVVGYIPMGSHSWGLSIVGWDDTEFGYPVPIMDLTLNVTTINVAIYSQPNYPAFTSSEDADSGWGTYFRTFGSGLLHGVRKPGESILHCAASNGNAATLGLAGNISTQALTLALTASAALGSLSQISGPTGDLGSKMASVVSEATGTELSPSPSQLSLAGTMAGQVAKLLGAGFGATRLAITAGTYVSKGAAYAGSITGGAAIGLSVGSVINCR